MASPALPTQCLVDILYLTSGAFESIADLPGFEKAPLVAIGIALGVSVACDLAHIAKACGYGGYGVGLAAMPQVMEVRWYLLWWSLV